MSSKILLVEDDNNLREIFEMRLQAEGFSTVVASDGEEALVVALREKPDLIIADVMMPKMSGFEMLETLRATPDMNKVKVVVMTALGQAEDRTRGEALGVVKYLVKSQVTLEDFVRVVKEVMGTGSDESSAQNSETSEQVPKDKVANNMQEGGQKMPDDTNPTPTPPLTDSGPAPLANPISGGDTPHVPADDQMSTAQAHQAMQSQVDDFASGTPPGTPAATDAPDIPVASPPSDPPPSDDPQPPTPPPSPDAPTTT
ncbi:response regulator [Candidatus Saccharibacteria bacterium]|nr:response regulator [Candidatus Saccharibacteria bacterium]